MYDSMSHWLPGNLHQYLPFPSACRLDPNDVNLPCTAKVRGLLDDPKVVDSSFDQPDSYNLRAISTANNNNFDLFFDRLALNGFFDPWVLEKVRQVSIQRDVLLHSLTSSKPSVALRQILFLKRYRIKRKRLLLGYFSGLDVDWALGSVWNGDFSYRSLRDCCCGSHRQDSELSRFDQVGIVSNSDLLRVNIYT